MRLAHSARALLAGWVFLAPALANGATDSGIYVGTTPCGAPVRAFLGISPRAKCDLIRWDVWLALGVNGNQPPLRVTAQYGVEGKTLRKIEKDGLWLVGQGTVEHPDATVYRLQLRDAEMRLWRVGPNTVYFLDDERKLLVGDGSYSYALSTAISERSQSGQTPELSYTLAPLAAGADVFGVFEGRTPCGLSQVLGVAVSVGCHHLKWRATLFCDPNTRALVRYRLEGSLFPAGPRDGAISYHVSTAFNRDASVFNLEPPPGDHPLYLMRGDDNVFFFVDRTGNLGLGNREFSYVLNRRAAP